MRIASRACSLPILWGERGSQTRAASDASGKRIRCHSEQVLICWSPPTSKPIVPEIINQPRSRRSDSELPRSHRKETPPTHHTNMASAPSFRSIVGIPPSTASTSDSTLVIIDAQNEYATGKLHVEGVETSRKAIASVLEKYRAAKAPVVHVTHDTPEGAPVFTPGTDFAKEFEELTPKEGESVVRKQHPGSFTGTKLQEILEGTGRKKVVITGYMVCRRPPYSPVTQEGGFLLTQILQAHICVSTTTRQASERGWDPIVVEDAVGTRNIPGSSADELKRVVLNEIADGFGTVIQSGDIQ